MQPQLRMVVVGCTAMMALTRRESWTPPIYGWLDDSPGAHAQAGELNVSGGDAQIMLQVAEITRTREEWGIKTRRARERGTAFTIIIVTVMLLRC
ncbi:hypothetical protein B0I35DRAFT_423844 [Stachybotrys elegans]|uniref:Uncharacterized protein n=1 Tax=Stachybotrys elegans TaxID=80388 RepID=A0A8K0WUR1_9HYPO|nr:hypothetical protein B0I35DRAFT_423844 [Stachybotrys elegans]